MNPILQTPRPPFNGSFRVTIGGKRSIVVVRKSVVSEAPHRVGFLHGLSIDDLMKMVAAKSGTMRCERS